MIISEYTACFTGHRVLPSAALPLIKQRLSQAIKHLIERGVTDFLCGGALGFGQLAGPVVLEAKRKYPHVSLIMVLPCLYQDEKWARPARERYTVL